MSNMTYKTYRFFFLNKQRALKAPYRKSSKAAALFKYNNSRKKKKADLRRFLA